MGTVFLKNTTSSSITVAGYTVHYIDSTDAEIVEVEGSGGGSTSSDDATGTISGVTLPTAHSYTGVSFDSLRYYAKGTLSNTGSIQGSAFGEYGLWFYGTLTWEDATLGDLTSKITTNSASSGVLLRQQYFRIIFIYDGISGVHPSDTNETTGNQITEYSYSNGVHSIRFYAQSTNWYTGTYAGRIQFRYLDGTTTFQNLSAFDLITASGGSLSKDTTTDRYDMYNTWAGNITVHALYGGLVKCNAFKFTLNNTPYYYVIDGTHNTWTDDLSAWGYSEVQPVAVLPTVSVTGDFGTNNWLFCTAGGEVRSIEPNSSEALFYASGSGYVNVLYEQSCSYSVLKWYFGTGSSDIGTNGSLSIVNSGNYIAAKNDTSSAINLYALRCAVCSSSQATVVLAYNSSNVAYNAFKYTANNTDYYYVLDGTQTDWTDDLSSIGYSLTPAPSYSEETYYYWAKDWTSVSAGSWVQLYIDGNTPISADSLDKYELIRWYSSSSDSTGSTASMSLIITSTQRLAIENTSSGTLYFQRATLKVYE